MREVCASLKTRIWPLFQPFLLPTSPLHRARVRRCMQLASQRLVPRKDQERASAMLGCQPAGCLMVRSAHMAPCATRAPASLESLGVTLVSVMAWHAIILQA